MYARLDQREVCTPGEQYLPLIDTQKFKFLMIFRLKCALIG